MKASVSPATLILAAIGLLVSSAFSQDAVVLKDGQRREGQILGVTGDSLRIKVGPAETGIPLAGVSSVTMTPPKAFDDAVTAWQKGDAAATIAVLKPLVGTYLGLPTKWSSRAAALLGEAYVTDGKITEAEAAFADFQKAYPDDANSADVGLARIAVAKKDYETARAKLTPIVEGAAKELYPSAGENAVFGRALLLMGEIQESTGDNPAALSNYLLAATVFREDKAVVAKAEARANALEQKKVIVP
jgi:tetratricopeptide (TPR) repeat protein